MYDPIYTVVHLTMRKDETKLAVGTGVFYSRGNKSYIITAWHNVTGRDTETLEPISKTAALPNNIIASFYIKIKNGFAPISLTIPLEGNEKATYLIHPQGYPKVDVVAIPIDLAREYKLEGKISTGDNIARPIKLNSLGNIIHIQDCEFTRSNIIDYSETLYVSDDIFILGYPKGLTDHTMQPIWKRATVATVPQLGWYQQKQFLVDCASKEGMSGAPAIYYNRNGIINTGNTYYIGFHPICIFHGIYVGRIGSTSEFEAQIGRIWKREVIDEIIDENMYDYLPDQLFLPDSVIQNKIEENWPKEDDKDFTNLILKKQPVYYIFLHKVMESINGRGKKKEVGELILKYAKNKLSNINSI